MAVIDGTQISVILTRLDRLADDIATLRDDLDRYVLREVYAAEQRSLNARLEDLEARARAEEADRTSLRRGVLFSVVVPSVLFLVSILVNR